jgi:hypothetical protein
MKMRILASALILATYAASAFPDPVAKPGITPVQAELIADMHARLLKVGSTVFARVTVDWHGADCVLRSGAILQAQVVSIVPYTQSGKTSEVGLAFTRAQCGEMKMGDYGLLLAAMAAPPQNEDLGILGSPMPLSVAPGAGAIASMKIMQFSAISMQINSQIDPTPVLPKMRMGDVSGIRGLKLSVGSGPSNSSLLTAHGHDVLLEKHTMLLLVPSQGAFPHPASGSGPASQTGAAGHDGSPESNPPAAATPASEDIDLCVPPQCADASPSGTEPDEARAAASLSIRELGYAERPQRVLDRFENDEALAYLGPRELLVAFNPHILAPRYRLGRAGMTVRVIRAALVDTETRRVNRTVDWELPDTREFLWPLSPGRILVHAGSELRVYGEGLKVLNRITLDGPLAFVRVTPDGSFIAVGVIHERHTPELHEELRETLGVDPEEDVTLLVLNRNFEPIVHSAARTGVIAPILLNEGQARLLAQPNMRYRIAIQTWDNHSSTLARFSSSCTPELSSFAPDLIFVVSCDRQTQAREYRVLHSSGKLALRGASNLNEAGQDAKASANHEAFVVKTVQSSLPMTPGALFTAADFPSEELGVYSTADGKRLLGVKVGSPSSSRDGYALSPDGSQLAVLAGAGLAFYSVPQK